MKKKEKKNTVPDLLCDDDDVFDVDYIKEVNGLTEDNLQQMKNLFELGLTQQSIFM